MAGRAPVAGEGSGFTPSFPSSGDEAHYFSHRGPRPNHHIQPYVPGAEPLMTPVGGSHFPSATHPPTHAPPTHSSTHGLSTQLYGLPTQLSSLGPVRRQYSPQLWSPYPRAPSHHYGSIQQQAHSSGWVEQALPTRRRTPLRPTVIVNKEVRSPRSFKLSVLTYNLLAQELISSNPYLYSERNPAHLDWEFRKKNLLSELSQNSVDLLCLQEIQGDQYESWFSPLLAKQGYSGLYKGRTGEHTDGCALFYKHDRLKLLEHKLMEFRTEFKVLNRDNVGIIAKFVHKECRAEIIPKSSFCVATTHLLYNPKAGEVKLAQLGYLLAELHQMASTPGKEELLPVILCGDFNSTPASHLYNFITSSVLNYSNLSAAEVAGYHRRRGSQRAIPQPLFPSSMAIGNNCVYKRNQEDNLALQHTDKNESVTAVGEGRVLLPQIASIATQSTQQSCSKLEDLQMIQQSPSRYEPNTHCSTSEANPTSQCISVLTHPFRLKSAYPYASMSPHKATVTTFHQSAFETVDYVFYSPVTDSKGFHLLNRKALPSTHVLLGLGPQPHEFLSSDHLSLCVMFQLLFKS